jgi:hypothetical protein
VAATDILLTGRYTLENYDNNDLGINFYTNFYNFYSNVSYRILKPTKVFNTLDSLTIQWLF